jgi:hypothetical protein
MIDRTQAAPQADRLSMTDTLPSVGRAAVAQSDGDDGQFLISDLHDH